MLGGAFFMIVAALGVLRMPDLLMRMHAATKAGTLGAGMVLIAVAVHYGELGIAMRAIATVVFLFLTAPVAAHMIGRAAYFVGIRLWEGTFIDEIRGQYDEHTHRLGASRQAGDSGGQPPKPPEGMERG